MRENRGRYSNLWGGGGQQLAVVAPGRSLTHTERALFSPVLGLAATLPGPEPAPNQTQPRQAQPSPYSQSRVLIIKHSVFCTGLLCKLCIKLYSGCDAIWINSVSESFRFVKLLDGNRKCLTVTQREPPPHPSPTPCPAALD